MGPELIFTALGLNPAGLIVVKRLTKSTASHRSMACLISVQAEAAWHSTGERFLAFQELHGKHFAVFSPIHSLEPSTTACLFVAFIFKHSSPN